MEKLLIILDKGLLDMCEEIWKDMVGYEEYFKVSSFGNIYSKRTNKKLKLTKSKTGYLCFTTQLEGRNSKCILFRVHREVAKAFIPVPSDLVGYENSNHYGVIPVNHIDGNKLNNNVCNLEWTTYRDNLLHAYANNLIPKYTLLSHPNFTLSEEQVKFIVDNYNPENRRKWSERALSRCLKCDRESVSSVLKYFGLK